MGCVGNNVEAKGRCLFGRVNRWVFLNRWGYFCGFPLVSGLCFRWVLVFAGFLVGFPLVLGSLIGWVL